MEYNPNTESSASSLATMLRCGELLENLTMARNAPNESERTLANALVLGSQILNATKRASASQRVVNPDSPRLARNRRRSSELSSHANHSVGRFAWNLTPANPHGHASVAK